MDDGAGSAATLSGEGWLGEKSMMLPGPPGRDEAY
jgi:hypothetical protein